tara:strand:+ start:974 stop:1246 length:273 start_codon:yes stop_codon:yes gene_type:complete
MEEVIKMGDYNGWTNRETWLVGLHFNPETLEDVEFIKREIEELEDWVWEKGMNFLSDYVDFSKINWYEIEESIKAERAINPLVTPKKQST